MLAIAPSKSNTVQERTDGEDSEDEEVDASVGAERMVVLVEGPKHVGKSTFARLVVNRLLSRFVPFPKPNSVEKGCPDALGS